MTTPLSMATLFGPFSGGEVVLIIAVVLILSGARRIPELYRGLRKGISDFREACDDVAHDIHAVTAPGGWDEAAHDAGRSLGGIYGKAAAQALAPDNKTAELYDPAVFQKQDEQRRANRAKLRNWILRRFRSLQTIWHRLVSWLKS